MQKSSKAYKHLSKSNMTVVGRVIIEPHSLGMVHVGIYEDVLPVPEIKVEIKPDVGESLSAILKKRDDYGEYSLAYFFQNYGDEACHVTVSLKDEQNRSPHPA